MTEQMKRVWVGATASKWALPLVLCALGLGILTVWAADDDNDGMDSVFEAFFGLNTASNDAALDLDSDSLDNLGESFLWTDPFLADTDRDLFTDGSDSNPVSRAYIPWGAPFFTGTNDDVVYTWPDWMVSAFKSGGSWDTNLPAWHVAASETNPAALAIELDRTILTNDLRLKIGLAGSYDATLYLDLYDTNGLVILTNVLNNLFDNIGTNTSLIFPIPLEAHTDAVGLWLRHGAGDVTVSESLLYVDLDGDGLDADQEWQLGTSDAVFNGDPGQGVPADPDPDSDGDGMTDLAELELGFNPLVYNVYTRLPFIECFETDTVLMGDIGGQNGWRVSVTNAGFVQTNAVFAGAQAMRFNAVTDSGVKVSQFFANPATNQIWMDVRVKVVPALAPAACTNSATGFFFDGDGHLVVLDGLLAGTNRWVTLTNALPVVEGSWARVSVRLDYDTQTWRVYLDGVKLAEGLGFGCPVSELHAVEQVGRRGYIDDFVVSVDVPAGITAVDPYPVTTISGAVTYLGAQQGVVRVMAGLTTTDWTAQCEGSALDLGAYTLTNVPQLATVWVKAYRDTNGNGQKDFWEPFGVCESATMIATSAVTGVDIVLVDPVLDPTLDTDGDGMTDAVEIKFGKSPVALNVYAHLPYIENFETNTVLIGDINSQNGWQVSAPNAVLVQTNNVFAGAQAMAIKAASDTEVTVSQYFAEPGTNQIWMDVRLKVIPSFTPAGYTDNATAFYFSEDNRLVVLDGRLTGTNRWVTLTNGPALVEGSWARVSMRLDYDAQTWLVCVNGVKRAEGLGFGCPVSALHVAELAGSRGYSDDFIVSSEQPASLSLDGDSLPEDWEMTYFGNLAQTDSGDNDSDGVNNLEEFEHGSSPLMSDTDSDQMPDRWEIDHNLNPASAADAVSDPDGDGLSNLTEYGLQTDPQAADTDQDGLGDGAEINSWHTSPLLPDTESDGMPDKWEVDHNLNPLVNDTALDPDNDGLTNLNEFLAGTDPHNPDTDGDGLADGTEVNTSHTNPLKSDTEGDGMPDKWEVDHALNPLVNDAASDPDGDALTNLQEYRYGTNPGIADTDADGVADGSEVFAHTDPLVQDFNGTFVDVLTLNGSEAFAWIGTWTPHGTVIYAGERSGSLDYAMPVLSNGAYVLAVQVTQHNELTAQNVFDMSLSLDGIESGRQTVKAAYGANNTVLFFLPKLAAGDHVVRLRWLNTAPNTFLQVNSLTLRSYGGPDANANGSPDWLDTRSASLFNMNTQIQYSVVSPVCVEGSSVYQECLNISATFVPEGQTQQVVSIQHGLGNDWYANVCLSPTNETDIVLNDLGSGTVQTNVVLWKAINMLNHDCSTNFAVRIGSSLQFAGWPVEATNGVVAVTILDSSTNAVTNLLAVSGTTIPYRFDHAGNFMVQAVYSNDLAVTNSSLPVKVVSGYFNGYEAACATGQARTWDCPGITMDAVVVADSPLSVTASNLSVGVQFTLMNPTDTAYYMVARLGTNGPVLDSAKISAIYADHGTYFRVVETFADGSRMVEVRLQLGYVPSDLQVQLHIFVGGVTFMDGTLEENLTAADFNELGVYTYRMIQSAASMSSTCHSTKLYQSGVYIGGN